MTYTETTPTGAVTGNEVQRLEILRKLTSSQGARSSYYDVPVTTGRVISGETGRWQKQTFQRSPKREPDADLARREHIGRLLRECLKSSTDLLQAGDPQDAALAGVRILNLLQDMWAAREAREENWREIINLLQILLTGEEFESLSRDKRTILHTLFETGVLTRTVSQHDLSHIVRLLHDAGFDLWRGVGERVPKNT
jgi:hypothetical protein